MEYERKFEIFTSVLKTFHDHGVLKEMVLIGSWCQLFYQDMFTQGSFVPTIRTKDIDLLVPYPRNVKMTVDVPKLLESLDFEIEFNLTSKYTKFMHEDFTVEFLMPLRGSGNIGVEKVKPLSITVQGLRYLDFAKEDLMATQYKGCQIIIPKPEVFSLLKFIIHEERKNPEKMAKDLASAQDLGTMLIGEEKHRENLKQAFNRKPKKHQKRLLRITKEKALDVYEVLTENA
jgi:hypothetical protein